MEIIAKDKILIVNRDPDDVKLYQLIFRDLFTLLIAHDTSDALDKINSDTFKVVIADNIQVSASVIDFFEVLSKEHPFLQKILVTSHTDRDFIQDAINRGRIYSYLPKPFIPHRMTIAIEKAIGQHDLLKSNEKLVTDLQAKNEHLNQVVADLQREEKKIRSIFNANPDPILIVRQDGEILAANPKSHDFFCDAQHKGATRNLSELVPLSLESQLKDYLIQADSVQPTITEMSMVLKGNQQKEFELNCLPLQYQGNDALMITLRDLSVRKEMEKQILKSVIQTEEKERRRFAQELHDGIGPLLSTTKLYLQWFNKPDSKMDKAVIIRKVEETLEETISSLREISNNISPNTLITFGLNTALQNFIEHTRNASGITVDYKNLVNQRLNSELEITIYRLLCECITNSLKHADAEKIVLELEEEGDILKVSYTDNGKGFEVNRKMSNGQGNGLLNMKSRVHSLGGQIMIDSSKTKGTHISMKFKYLFKNDTE